MTVQEGNKLIAEFMGLKTGFYPYALEYKDTLMVHTENGKTIPKYHSSWDWIMPVVEKINTIAIDNYGEMGVYIHPNMVSIGENVHDRIVMITIANHPSLIDMVWLSVITFIQWYNTQKQ